MKTRWEYKTIVCPLGEALEMDALQKLGEEGWELCAFHMSEFGTTIRFFKRPKEDA